MLLLRLVGNSSKPFGCFEGQTLCEFVESCTGYKTRPKIERETRSCADVKCCNKEKKKKNFIFTEERREESVGEYLRPTKKVSGVSIFILKREEKKVVISPDDREYFYYKEQRRILPFLKFILSAFTLYAMRTRVPPNV